MVDVVPWGGNYTGTIVQNNTIIGGFATDSKSISQTDGQNVDDVIVKSVIFLSSASFSSHRLCRIGIAIGPQTWFGDQFGANISSSGSVLNNTLTGAFGYGVAITSANNFTVQGNILFGNTSFIGSRGPNCSASDPTPASAAFIVGLANVTASTLQSDFQPVQDAKSLTCVQPPNGGNYWPYGGNPSPGNFTPPISVSSSSSRDSKGHSSAGAKAALAVGIIAVVVAIIAAIIFVRRWALKRKLRNSGSMSGSKG